jgi:hypothetical protein
LVTVKVLALPAPERLSCLGACAHLVPLMPSLPDPVFFRTARAVPEEEPFASFAVLRARIPSGDSPAQPAGMDFDAGGLYSLRRRRRSLIFAVKLLLQID